MVRILALLSLALLSAPSACSPILSETGGDQGGGAYLALASSPTLPVLSAPLPTSTPICTTGSLASTSLPTTNLPKPLRFNIYLPPCYAEHTDQYYPVLYLFHGQTYDETQWVRLGATAAADRLIVSGQIPPFIIVMPYDPSWKEPAEYGFADVIIKDLIPYVDLHYRTLADRSHRAVGGLSRGGGWALHFGLTRPDLFGAIGAHAPVIFATDGTHVDDWLAAIPLDQMPSIYLDIDENDQDLAGVRILEDTLTAANVPHEWHLNKGFHNETYWSAHVEEYLRWYAAGWSAVIIPLEDT